MKIACYERVSTQEQSIEGISIDAQKAALEAWASGQTIVDHYTDIGVSGRRPHNKRPEMVRLLQDVERGKIDLVIFCRLDRWFRSVKEYYKVQDVLDRHKVAWRAVQEDYETETASGRFKVNIMLSVSQDEAERTGERVKAVNEFKRAKGEFCSGNTPIGTKLENKILVPSAEAWKVKEMFTAYLNTGSAYAAIPVLREKGIVIGDSSLKYALHNENYLRLGIVTPEEWQRAQELRGAPAPRTRNCRTYLFTGLLFCSCGRRLGGMHNKGNYYYRCPGFYEDKTCTAGGVYSEAMIEKHLTDTLLSKVRDWNLTYQTAPPRDTAPIKRRLDKLTDLYLNDLIDKAKYEREYTAAKRELEDAEQTQKPIDEAQTVTALEAYDTLSRAAKKTFWLRVLKRATVTKNGIDYTICFIS